MEKFVFRSDEKVSINYNKPFSFQVTDWRSFDFKPEYNRETDKDRYRKEFRVQLFGVSTKGRSVSAVITGFKPFFYAEIPEDWTSTNVEQLVKAVQKKVQQYEVKSLLSYKIIKKKKFRGFTNNTYYPFIQFEFQSLSGFNKYKRALEEDIILGNGKKIQLPLYESNLEPIMRLMHISDIEPAGWVQLIKYSIPDTPNSKCQIDIEANFKYLKKVESTGIAPLIILSFDIESDSSHGDFPQAKKRYTKLATDIINHYQKARSTITKLQKTGENPQKLEYLVNLIQDKEKYFYELIRAGFLKETPFRDEEIHYVFTKDGMKPKDSTIKGLIEEVIKICDRPELTVRGNRQLKEGTQKVLRRWVNKKDKFKPDESIPNEKNVYELEELIRDVAKEDKLDSNNLYIKVFNKDVCITLLTNLFDKHFPKVEGDPVIQIASVIYKYGDPNICYRHIVTLDTCDPIEGAEVVACMDESDVLIEWANFINKLDPDIMTGYNIFGFDYSFLYYRAQELGVLEEFSKISRLPEHEAALVEKNLSSAALGDNTMYFIDMVGRVQIDLLKVIQRDHNLGSYKLDSVAEHFISGKVYGMRQEEPEWIQIENTFEIEKDNYIIIRQSKDGDKFNRGEKIKVLEKESITTQDVDENGKTITKVKDWIKLDIPFEKKVLSKKPLWGLGKDDFGYKDIFELQKTGGSSGRRTIAVYCIQDCVLVIRIIRKLEIIANNIGMANVSNVPFSYIFLRGQGVKIFSLVAKECRSLDFLIPVLKGKDNKAKDGDFESVDSKEKEIKRLMKSFEDEGGDTDVYTPINTITTSGDDDSFNNFRKGGDGDYHMGEIDNLASESAGIDTGDDDGYEGAIVLNPRPGIYLNEPVSVLDYGSLYPSSMISENLSHDSIVLDPKFDNLPGLTYGEVTYDVKKWIDPNKKSLGKHTVGQKTCRFVNFPDGPDGKPVRGVMPLILQKLLAQRKACKKKTAQETEPFKKTVWDALQLAYKVTANSLYGQIGARTSPIYLKDVAASTTATGRGLLTFARDFVLANFEGSQIVYGDSVIGDTPLLLRNSLTNQIFIESIKYLASKYNNRDDNKESCELNDIETWTEKGWTKVQRVIRHKLAPEKKLFRITTHTGSVVVTDDHSLLTPNGSIISPKNIQRGDELLHSFPTFNTLGVNNVNEYVFYNGVKLNPEIAQLIGIFAGDALFTISDSSYKIAKKYQAIGMKYFNDIEWNICEMHSFYSLNLSNMDFILDLIYNNDLHKKVPDCIINGDSEIMKSFLIGLYDTDNTDNNNDIDNTTTGMIFSLGIYTIYSLLGYNVYINTHTMKMDSYEIVISNNFNYEYNQIKMIEEWKIEEEYVYDLTTDNHHFHAGVGSLIVHNTDSIFIKFKLVDEDGNKMFGVPALQKSIDTGLHAEHLIQRYLKPPHVLEYEKTFWPFILFTKKRYVGNLYETDINEYKQKSMGIVLKRRDNAPIVKYVYGGIIDCILNKKSLELSIDFLKESLMDLINNKFDVQMLVISKTLRASYKDPESIAHKVLADRMGERDPGNKPQSNDRIPFVYIKVKTKNPKEKILQGDKIEHVNYVREHNLKPDFLTYLENQIQKPVSQIYELAVSQLPGYNKSEDYFENLEAKYRDKYSDKSNDFIMDKIQQAKYNEVEALLFMEALRKARNQKANLQEISSWLISDDNSKDNNQQDNDNSKDDNKKDKLKVLKVKQISNNVAKRTNKSILDWLV